MSASGKDAAARWITGTSKKTVKRQDTKVSVAPSSSSEEQQDGVFGIDQATTAAAFRSALSGVLDLQAVFSEERATHAKTSAQLQLWRNRVESYSRDIERLTKEKEQLLRDSGETELSLKKLNAQIIQRYRSDVAARDKKLQDSETSAQTRNLQMQAIESEVSRLRIELGRKIDREAIAEKEFVEQRADFEQKARALEQERRNSDEFAKMVFSLEAQVKLQARAAADAVNKMKAAVANELRDRNALIAELTHKVKDRDQGITGLCQQIELKDHEIAQVKEEFESLKAAFEGEASVRVQKEAEYQAELQTLKAIAAQIQRGLADIEVRSLPKPAALALQEQKKNSAIFIDLLEGEESFFSRESPKLNQ